MTVITNNAIFSVALTVFARCIIIIIHQDLKIRQSVKHLETLVPCHRYHRHHLIMMII